MSFRNGIAPVTLMHSGDADQALLAIAWPTDDDDDLNRVVGLNLLAEVMKLELTDTLREKLGATYSPAASSFRVPTLRWSVGSPRTTPTTLLELSMNEAAMILPSFVLP